MCCNLPKWFLFLALKWLKSTICNIIHLFLWVNFISIPACLPAFCMRKYDSIGTSPTNNSISCGFTNISGWNITMTHYCERDQLLSLIRPPQTLVIYFFFFYFFCSPILTYAPADTGVSSLLFKLGNSERDIPKSSKYLKNLISEFAKDMG